MTTQTMTGTSHFRIIAAIAAKDVIDGIRNRSILSSLFTVIFLLALYQFLPMLNAGVAPMDLALYDAGSSAQIPSEFMGLQLAGNWWMLGWRI